MSCVACGKPATHRAGEDTLCALCHALKGEGCALCGGIILADTEDWQTPLCPACYSALGEPEREPPILAQHVRHNRALVRIMQMTRTAAKLVN